MSQAAVKPDGSDSPARKSCKFYKLMVASILQDKKLVNFNLLSCSVCLFGYRENEEKSSCVIIVLAPIQVLKMQKSVWLLRKLQEFQFFSQNPALITDDDFFIILFFFLLQILLDDFLSSWELKIFKFVNQARLKKELEISLLLMSLLFSDCFDKQFELWIIVCLMGLSFP